ncbi:hypothetical protein DM02DRAFT_61761 [Periconia macrospinosa]|uniref:Uncharacterized protein n=1 Tax=Periconia macrospinosa TaxID=97972 RepID=A0A2V1DIK6_9PLEO|nr:hypothetical protein DM02DRAFT_61761 [Periconia macrospinosa]
MLFEKMEENNETGKLETSALRVVSLQKRRKRRNERKSEDAAPERRDNRINNRGEFKEEKQDHRTSTKKRKK